MNWVSIIAIYALFWVLTAFVILPIGVRTHDELGLDKVANLGRRDHPIAVLPAQVDLHRLGAQQRHGGEIEGDLLADLVRGS